MSKFPLLKGPINFKSTFTKLIVSYILLSFVILTISTFTIYEGYRKQIIAQSNNTYNKILMQANYYTQNTLDWATSYILELYTQNNDTIYNIMYSTDEFSLKNSAGMAKINQISSMMPLTQSIYIYNNNLKRFYSSTGVSSPIDGFFDKQIVSILKSYNGTPISHFIVRRIPANNVSSEVNVLTLILSNTRTNNDNFPEGALILNLRTDQIENYFRTISNSDSRIFAVNNTGNIILSSDENNFDMDVSHDSYIKRVLSSKTVKGYFFGKINNQSCVINYLYSNDLKLKFISITPYKSILYSINSMGNLLLLIFIIISIFAVAFSYVCSKKIYSPIGNIVSSVKRNLYSNSQVQRKESNDELDYLSFAINKILVEKASIKELPEKDKNFIKQKVLKDLLLNSSDNIEIIKNRLSDLNICLLPVNLLVYVLRIDSYIYLASHYSKDEIELLYAQIANFANEITGKKFKCEAIDMGTDHISVIINIDKDSLTEKVQVLITLIKQVQKTVFERTQITVTAGLGEYSPDLSGISRSHMWAYEYTNYRIKYGCGSILSSENILPNVKDAAKYPEEKEKLLFNAIKVGKLDSIESVLSNILNEISDYSYKDMMLYIAKLSMDSKAFLGNLMQITSEDIDLNSDYPEDNISNLETMDEIKNWFMGRYRDTVFRINESKLHKKENLINSIKKYIASNYQNPELSTEYLADYIKISPNYLRTIFKEFENQSLSDYINGYRFEKAKYFLKKTNLSVADISFRVGFSNANYFYTSFKKSFGISPSEWRKKFTVA